MMNAIRFTQRFCAFLILAIFFVCSLPIPASASGADTYTLELQLNFFDSETVDHTADDYSSCAFLIQDADSRYLTAELDEASGVYHVTGTVITEADATRFLCGRDSSNPAILRVSDLSEGRYVMTHYEAPSGYSLCPDTISIMIQSNAVTIDDSNVEVTHDGMFSFKFLLVKGFKLPGDGFGGCKYRLALRIFGITLMAVSAYALYSIIAKSKNKME